MLSTVQRSGKVVIDLSDNSHIQGFDPLTSHSTNSSCPPQDPSRAQTWWKTLIGIAMVRSTAAKSKASKSSGGSSSSGSKPMEDSSQRSPSASPKVVVGSYDCSGLPKKWDDDAVIRERIRSNFNLVVRIDHEFKPANGYVESTTDNVKLNAPIMGPVCDLMKDNDLKPPALDVLIEQINLFYVIAKVWGGYESYYQQAWAIRRLLGKLKTYTYREFPPEDMVFLGWPITGFDVKHVVYHK